MFCKLQNGASPVFLASDRSILHPYECVELGIPLDSFLVRYMCHFRRIAPVSREQACHCTVLRICTLQPGVLLGVSWQCVICDQASEAGMLHLVIFFSSAV